jgi:colanic acid biosynthesis protein WcaH
MSSLRDTAIAPLLLSFATGIATTIIVNSYFFSKKDRRNGKFESALSLVQSWTSLKILTPSLTLAGATVKGNDLSLFYGNVEELTKVTDRRKYLPGDVYKKVVQDSVVCCVDILLVRFNPAENRKECLLVLRSTEPAKGLWWLPGGRLLKGETFFAAARRKARQETGLTAVTPVQVLGVWNTFFPTSHWDDDESKGTQTVNPIVLVEVLQAGADVELDETCESYQWISLDPEAAAKAGQDRYVLQALLRLQAWDQSYATV